MPVENSNVISIASTNPVYAQWNRRRARAAGVPVFNRLPGLPNALKPRVRVMKSGRPVTAASMPVPTGLTRNGKAAVAPPKPLPAASFSPFSPVALAGTDGVFDFVKELIPSNTVVGKALRGDYAGAGQGAAREVGKVVTALTAHPAPGAPAPAAGQPGPIYYDPNAPAPQGSGFLVNKPLLFASLGLGALGIFLLVRSRR